MSIILDALTRTLTVFFAISLDTKPRDIHEPRSPPSTFITHNLFTCKPLTLCPPRLFVRRRDGVWRRFARLSETTFSPRRICKKETPTIITGPGGRFVETLFNCISSVYHVRSAKVYRLREIRAEKITVRMPHVRVQRKLVVRFHVCTDGLFRSIFRRVCLFPPFVRVRQLNTRCVHTSVYVCSTPEAFGRDMCKNIP